MKRGRGRPPGSKNKPKTGETVSTRPTVGSTVPVPEPVAPPPVKKRKDYDRQAYLKPFNLPEAARKRLRHLAGHHVPVTEIAAVLRLEFKIPITAEIIDQEYADEILVGRAYSAVQISEKTIDCALEGSATAQKTLFDRNRDAGMREDKMGGGRQLRQIKLVVVDGLVSRLRSESDGGAG
jgi:hypothetical protein